MLLACITQFWLIVALNFCNAGCVNLRSLLAALWGLFETGLSAGSAAVITDIVTTITNHAGSRDKAADMLRSAAEAMHADGYGAARAAVYIFMQILV